MRKLASFTAIYYFKQYFEIKINCLLKEGPNNILSSLKLFSKLSDEVKDIIRDTLSRNAYHAHSENILFALLSSEDVCNRQFAINKIIDLRRGREFGETGPRKHLNPVLNFEAQCLRDLIDWEYDVQ